MPTPRFLHFSPALAAAALLALHAASALADEAPKETPAPAFKFNTGLYSFSQGGGTGLDVNLRNTSRLGNAWIGGYRQPAGDIKQARAGWDNIFTLGPLRLMPSLQVASGGFIGGSANVETGDSWFAGAGIGRTNLRNYVNLNFDPNDAWMLSGGYRWEDNRSLALQVIRDNRLNPDERHVHLVWRTPLQNGDRLTVDLLAKSGLVAGAPIHRVGLSVGYDWPRRFVRIAWDPKANFTPQDMLRLSAGVRF